MKKTTPLARVSFGFQHLDAAGLCTEADGIIEGLTGNAYITVLPVALGPVTTPGTISYQVATLRSFLSKLASGDKSKELSNNISSSANVLMLSLTTNGHSVQDQANTLAAGNLLLAKKIINSTGYKLSKEKKPRKHDFGAESKVSNEVFAHCPKAKKGPEGHLWRIGITTGKGIAPTTTKTFYTVTAGIVIKDLPSGSVVAIQHASVTGTTRPKKTSVPTTLTEKTATVVVISKEHHPVFSFGVDDPYAWTDWIFIVVK